MLYTITDYRREVGFEELKRIDFPQTYRFVEQAIEDAGKLWEDEDYLYEYVTINKTVELCHLVRAEKVG